MQIRKLIGAVAISILPLAIFSCSKSGPRVVDYPIINYANNNTIDITQVELTDTATILKIDASYYPGYWIKIDSDAYLQSDGKKYSLSGAEGIEPDSLFWMPESGRADFTLIFEPLPFSAKEFDFIESDEDGAFCLWNVDIYDEEPQKFPEGLPKELRKAPVDGPVPDPAFEIGTTSITFHMLSTFPANPKIGMYVNTLDRRQEEYTLDFDSSGVATVSFEQYGISKAFIVNNETNNGMGSITLYPGETIDYYIDMRITGQIAMNRRDKAHRGIAILNAHTGRYGNYDRMMGQHMSSTTYYGLQCRNGSFGDYRMSGEEYKNMVKSKYLANADSIEALDLPAMVKEAKLLRLQNDVLYAMSNYREVLELNYRSVNSAWDGRNIPADSIPAKLSDSDFEEVTTWFDVSNPKLVTINNIIGGFDWNSYGAKGDLSRSLHYFIQAAGHAHKQEPDTAGIDTLKTMSDPFFAAAVDSILAHTKQKYEDLSKNVSALPTPDVAIDKVFDAIVAPHKGKVVVVDLWNTWCGPCRNALAHNEPLKSDELADEDIVWIYIADESSDPVKYLEMIPDIKGLHYKVTEEQIDAIRKRFNVDGIPYYILVDRQGNAEGRPDIRDHDKYVSEIKAKLAKP